MDELSLSDILAILARRKKPFFLTAAFLFAAACAFVLSWSNYRSTATVEIEQSYIPANVTTPRGMSPDDMLVAWADQRINKIQQKVTSMASLAEIIAKLDLYPDARKTTPVAELADKMRRKIKLDFVSSAISNPAAAQKVSVEQLSAIAFNLSVDYSDAQLAQQITDELIARFMDEDLKQRRIQAQETSAFLAAQIAAMETSMAEQEKKISEFEKAHGESGPMALMFNQQAAANANLSLMNIDSQLASNEGTQGSLRAQLATIEPYSRVISNGQVLTTPAIQLKALQAQYATLTAQYGPEHPDVVKARNQIDSLKAQIGNPRAIAEATKNTAQLRAQITDAKTNLTAAEKTYGPDHPDTVALRRQVAKLEDQLAALPAGGSNAGLKRDADNPAYLALTAQLEGVEEQHKALTAQRDALVTEQAKYQRAVAENPGLEQDMAALTRDYENIKLRYRELKEKKQSADMGEQLEQDRKGQRLSVINPPTLGKMQPSRLLLLAAGLMIALIGGLGAIVVTETMNHAVHGAQHLTALTGAPPLVVVPHIYTQDEALFLRRRKTRLIMTLAVLGMLATFTFPFAVMPFDVLWSMVSRLLLKPS